jgi:hypothetical protein
MRCRKENLLGPELRDRLLADQDGLTAGLLDSFLRGL